MSTEWISWVTALLVVTSVIVKIVTANLLTRQREEVSRLQAEMRKQKAVSDGLVERRKSLADNVEFFERRLEENEALQAKLQTDAAAYEEAHRRHLEELGYDPDEEDPEAGLMPEPETGPEPGPEPGSETRVEAGNAADLGPAGAFTQADTLRSDAILAVLPPTGGDSDKLFLPDAVITELLATGVHVVDRSTINQRLQSAGLDLRHMLDEEEYYRLHEGAAIDAVVIINSRLMGSGIGSATCRVIHFPAGEILLSASYEQPGRDEGADDFESLTHTAQHIAAAISKVIRKPTSATGTTPAVGAV